MLVGNNFEREVKDCTSQSTKWESPKTAAPINLRNSLEKTRVRNKKIMKKKVKNYRVFDFSEKFHSFHFSASAFSIIIINIFMIIFLFKDCNKWTKNAFETLIPNDEQTNEFVIKI